MKIDFLKSLRLLTTLAALLTALAGHAAETSAEGLALGAVVIGFVGTLAGLARRIRTSRAAAEKPR